MKKNTESQQNTNNSNFDFIKFFKVCLRSWKTFAFFIFCFLVLIVFYIIVRTPKYEVDAQLKLPSETSMGGLTIDMAQSFSFGDMFGSSNIDNEVCVISSHNVFLNTAKDLKLNVSYAERIWPFKWNPVFTKTPIVVSTIPSVPDTLRTAVSFELKRLDADNVDIDVIVRKNKIMQLKNQTLPTVLETPYGPFTITKTEFYDQSEASKFLAVFTSYDKAAETYLELVDVFAPNKKADFIGLAYKTPDPAFGISLLNAIIANYNLVGSRIKDQKNYETLDFVNNRMESLKTEIALTESTMEQFKKNNKITLVEQDAAYELEKLARVELALIQTETESKILKETLDFVSNPNNKYSVIPNLPSSNAQLGETTEDAGSTANLISAATRELNIYNQLVLERMKLVGSSAKTGNASVKMIDEQIDALHGSLIASVSRAYETSQVKYNEASRQYNIAQSRLGTLPSLEKEYLGIQRNLLVQEQLYLFLLKQREEASMNIAKASHSIDIIDAPHKLTDELGLSNKMAIALAIFLGLVAAAAWVFTFKYKDAPTASFAETKGLIKAPLASATIMHNASGSDLPMKTADSAEAESFRKLRAEIQYLLSGFGGKTIAVESIGNSEGKTYIATNLALALSASGNATLLVDASMHKPDVAQMMGMPEGTGLAAALEKDEAPKINSCDGLSVITAGSAATRHPSELLSSGRFHKLMDKFKNDYDYIVIDTPSISGHSDALAISDIPDLTILVVRQQVTTPSQIEKINQLYSQARLKRIILVVNDLSTKEA